MENLLDKDYSRAANMAFPASHKILVCTMFFMNDFTSCVDYTNQVDDILARIINVFCMMSILITPFPESAALACLF